MTSEKNKDLTGGANDTIKSPLSYIYSFFSFINHNIVSLNSSKFFAGIIIILINIGSKFITIQFSKSTEEYLKYTISKQILFFGMAWMGTRDIYAALGLTAILTILSDYLFNEESRLCVIPHKYRVLNKSLNDPNQTTVSDADINAAIMTLEKAKREKQRKQSMDIYVKNFI